VWHQFLYSNGANGTDGCISSRHKTQQQEQRMTETITNTVTSIDNNTTTSTRTVVTTNGVVTSDTTSSSSSSSNVSTNTVINSDTNGSYSNYGSVTATGSCRTSTSLPSPNPSTPAVVSTSTTTTSGPTTTTVSTTGPTTGTTTTTTTSSGGTSNTLSDVSEYYYINDLRTTALGNCTGSPVPPATTGLDVCTNDVPQSGLDGASWQHMTTFTLGLGASGYMQFSPNYPTATSGDFFDVRNGTTANPAGGICSWQSSGACNWPVPVSNEQTTIDDLWHAAVNGRGTYFSATNPASLNAGLSTALAGVSARTGSSAAATTSNPNVTSGDNFVFSSTFTTQSWDGELVRQQLDLTTGVVSSTIDWSAQAQLDTLATTYATSRHTYTRDSTAANGLKSFDWPSLSTTQQAYFTTPNISSLSQFCVTGITCLSAADQINASGINLVNFLRGDRSNEGLATDTTKYYRQRSHVLGDIVNAEAVYVKLPLFNYADAGYSAYITAQASRQGMVYAASNDGMLHAFNATTGAEAWNYVPTMVLPNLYKLADKNYSANHQYFVDGTPVAGDVYFGAAWHTIVVGGLNAGGRGYYALDVTDPANPKALWEFTDANMGYTYGNPTITKLANGTWVVLVTSGYNNVPDATQATGDGVGRLYVLDASTGTQIAGVSPISTGAGSTTTPSGLSRISAWVTNATADNTALRVYGGDLLGNLWRFDINGNIGAAGYDAQKLVTFYANGAGTITQPITTRPELGDVSGVAVVYVGTGRFLGITDLSDTTQETFYAVKDTLGTTTYTNPQATGSNFVQQVVSNTTCPTGSPSTICTLGQTVRTSTSNTVNFATNNGWYINLPDGVGAGSGNGSERANTDPNLALGTLGFTTNVPNSSACTAGGYSYRYVVDYRTGAPVSTSTTGVSAIKLGNALSTRGVFVRLPNNTVVQLTRLSDGTTMTTNVPIGSGVAPVRRISWRELIQDQ
jgi:type IV pilus assembly protein PilY1